MNNYSIRQWFGLYLGPTLAFILYFIPTITNLSNEARAVLAVTVFIAIWWITEPIPMALTSLLPLILLPVTGGTSYETTSSAYMNPLVLMFLGGFTIALAIEKWNLHKRIAMLILLVIGTTSKRILLGISLGTAFLSMWISNAATALMMLPVALALITEVKEQNLFDQQSFQSFSKALLLIVAYSASIGGLATLIGSVPNAVFAGVMSSILHQEISFATWFFFAFPVTVVMLILLFVLINYQFPIHHNAKIPVSFVHKQLLKLGILTKEEKLIFLVFLLTASLWIFSEFIPLHLTDSSIALIGALSLFFIPSSNKHALLTWMDLKKIPWSILLLFGGGLSIATAFAESNLTNWIGGYFSSLSNYPYSLILIIFATAVLFMTEIMSNTAISNMFIPISIGLATVIGVEPFGLMAIVALSSTCAFMLPISTPPNAVVFGVKYLSSKDMLKTGWRLNVLAIFVIVAAVYFLLPSVFS
ncbi:SLC13 family permease [Alkalihalobacillus deserti]|uniref:SLC13 family permease n=1 Tax=Alkalihalobacillus deserti TaxID=2879466 RepID=UPI00355755B1